MDPHLKSKKSDNADIDDPFFNSDDPQVVNEAISAESTSSRKKMRHLANAAVAAKQATEAESRNNNWGHTIEEEVLQPVKPQQSKAEEDDGVWTRHYDFRQEPKVNPTPPAKEEREEREKKEEDILDTLGLSEASDATLADRQSDNSTPNRLSKSIDAEIERRMAKGEYDWEDSLARGELEEDQQAAREQKAMSRVADKAEAYDGLSSFEPISSKDDNPEAKRRKERDKKGKQHFEASKERRKVSIDDGSEFLTPAEKRMERALGIANDLLDEHLTDYYIEGAIDSLSEGSFDINPRGFVTEGFEEFESKKIRGLLSKKDRQKFWSESIGLIIDEKVRDWNELSAVEAAEHDAIIEAIARGAKLERTGVDEFGLHTTLPIGEHGDGKLQNFMRQYNVDPNSPEAKDASYAGFIGIIEAIKNDHDLTDEGFKALDWYFDNFDYNENLDDFSDTLDGYIEEADLAFNDKLDEYLDYRDELKRMQARKISRDQSTFEKISDLVEIATGQDFYGLESEELFPLSDTNGPKQNNDEKTSAKWPSGEQKIAAAYPKIEAIVQLDPNATFYQGEIFKENEHPYLVVRFGANGMNNVIVIPYGDASDAMFAWKGETGDDRDGWKVYFKNASIRTRSTEVKRFQCNGFSQGEVGAMNREWDRIEDFLGIELPDYVPASSDRVETPAVKTIDVTEQLEQATTWTGKSDETVTGTDSE
ncbi:MAG: hypothetical protein Q4F56_00770 [Candidatus Saccharibacteria bacterium]|nr:hypothetical protein [Candidatus Saccharibacteria bacterium]